MNEVAQKILTEIGLHGAISFARFMELALYCPVYGYYEKEWDNIGRRGDFYTSVSVGSLFGELLAVQFAEWLEPRLSSNSSWHAVPVQLVEAGAHDGRLAKDILGWLRQYRRKLYEKLEYWIVEPSATRHKIQQTCLAEFAGQVHWTPNLSQFHAPVSPAPSRGEPVGSAPAPGIAGIIFCNELLDAFPAHRLGWDAGRRAWFEWGVTAEHEQFVWTRLHSAPLDSNLGPVLPQALKEISIPLPDGFTIELSLAAQQWWSTAASVLAWGKLVAFDYGLTSEELFRPERFSGTLRGYRKHRLTADPLQDPGEQDLTVNPDFSAIQAAGEKAGLTTEFFTTQEQFLTQIAARIWQSQALSGSWTPAHTRQFQTLTHPEHLGRAFRVLVQARNDHLGAETCTGANASILSPVGTA